jgi:hypothetical protein
MTALSFNVSEIDAEVCIRSGSPASTVKTRKLNANRAFCAMNKKLPHRQAARFIVRRRASRTTLVVPPCKPHIILTL